MRKQKLSVERQRHNQIIELAKEAQVLADHHVSANYMVVDHAKAINKLADAIIKLAN
jgi:hypothetical protein